LICSEYRGRTLYKEDGILKPKLYVDDSEDSKKAVELVEDHLPECNIVKAVQDKYQLPQLMTSDGTFDGFDAIHRYLCGGWTEAEPRTISEEEAAKLSKDIASSPPSVSGESTHEKPVEMSDFCCPICQSDKYSPIYVRHSNDIIGPGHRSYSSITGYQCDQCSVRFGDPNSFTHRPIVTE
jgi:hypothetical protein